MKAIRIALVALCLLAIPAVLQAQTWSPEQQELLDHLFSIWDQVEENNQSTFAQWQDVVHPRDDLVWWFTNQGAPNDLEAVRKWHQGWETRGAQYTFLSVRPVAVRILDSVGMVWFWAFGEVEYQSGERHQYESKRLEIFHKTASGWEFAGGMVTYVVPFEAEAN
jgi:hypothetical protein